jgi:hypothetical protein
MDPVTIGALITGGASLLGTWINSREAGKAREQQDEMMSMQQGNLAFQRDLFEREFASMEEQRAYLRQQDALNRQQATLERQQAFDLYFQNNEQLQQERDYFIQRQEFVDKQAAQERAEQLGFMLQNQQIAAEERDFALAELARAQQIAAGERDEELRRYYDNQFRAEAERRYSIDQFERAQGIARAEREEEGMLRDALQGQLTSFQDELRRVQEGLGDIRRLDPLTQEYIDSQVGRYRDTAKDSYNEVIEQMASLNEADLRRKGISATDPGDTRSRMAQRLADDLAMAQQRAEQQALAYISGERGLLFDDIQQDIATRNAIMGETANVGLAGFDQMRGLMNTLPTENVAAPLPINSTILNAQFRSANDYNTPVAINSTQFAGALPSAIGQTINVPSGVGMGFSPPSAVTSPSSSTNMASALLDGLSTGYANMGATYGNQAAGYSQAAGQGFSDLGEIFTDYMAHRQGQQQQQVSPTYSYSPGATIMNSGGMTNYGNSFAGVYG